MRILLASSEVHPYSKTGGLGDMVSSLGKALTRIGHEITIITPLYRGVRDRFPELRRQLPDLSLRVGDRLVSAEFWSRQALPDEHVVFIGQQDYFDRPNLYTQNGCDYPDNAERFIFFSKAIAAFALREETGFDVVHAHDWQTALVPLLMKYERERAGQGNGLRTCVTIHNLAYQGVFPRAAFALTNLPADWFNMDTMEFYGQMNSLKAGIAFADVITTVSPRYAREIMTQEFGCGLEGLLGSRRNIVHGILNGVDYEEWNTTANPSLVAPYSLKLLQGKQTNKTALQRELGLDVAPDLPLFGCVSRLVEQKGVDLLLGALEELVDNDLQFVMLGSGHPNYESAFEQLAERHPEHVAVRLGYDMELSHRIEAASDFYVMPSRFEPCGLNQLYSLRYGTIPIVRAVGGLDDSVVDLNEAEERANGIKFQEATVPAVTHAIRKALALYEVPDLLEHYRRNGMTADFSCEKTAREYLRLYEETGFK